MLRRLTRRTVIAGVLLIAPRPTWSMPPGAPAQDPVDAQSDRLPRLIGLRICRVTVERPRSERRVRSQPATVAAIEFIVRTDGDVPARAYGPALFVGAIEVNQSERIGATTWRLLTFEPERLAAGAPIAWGWMKARPSDRASTPFRYQIERDPRVCAARP
jgi:hypothetical protein